MSLTRVTTMLDTDLWHKVTSGIWFGKIPPDFYPLKSYPRGRLVAGEIAPSDPARWSISAGGVYNCAHNYSPLTLGLMVEDANGLRAVAQVTGPQRTATAGSWGVSFGSGKGFAQIPSNQDGHGVISLDNFPRTDAQSFTLSMTLAENALTLTLLLSGTSYTLHTEQSYNTGVFAAALAAPFAVYVDLLIGGFAIDQYEAVDDGEGGYNYVGSPVCVLDWVNFASVE